MGTIDNHIFEKAGAKGCSDSDFNIVKTTCCNTYLVEDGELNEIYFDPADLRKSVDIIYLCGCPMCGSKLWNYYKFAEWPTEKTVWQWAYHQNQEVVKAWLKEKP